MKKSFVLVFAFCISGLLAMAGTDKKATLTVTVKNLKSKEGKVSVSLFKDEKSFLNDGESRHTVITQEGEASVTFDGIHPGVYAVSVIHDENGNGKLDTAVFGIPVEPYGFSNNARGTFGPASFDDSKFVVEGDKRIEINVE